MTDKKPQDGNLENELPDETIQVDDNWADIPQPLMFPERSWKLTLCRGYGQQSIRISLALIVFVVVFLLLWLGLTLFLLFGRNGADQAQEINRLKKENLLLHQRLNRYEAVVDSIYKRIDVLSEESSTPLGKGGGEYPYVPAHAHAKKAKGQSLESRFRALDGKLSRILIAIPGEESPPSVALDTPMPAPQSGDGIPSIYPTFGVISSGFGLRVHPILNELLFHHGIDIANEVGTPIYATADGVVRHIGYEPNYGKRMYITHSDGYETQYAHLYSYKVQEGDVVRKGQIIALMGDSGMSTGPHLHYEVIVNGYKTNPEAYLNRIDTTRFAGR
ncbi:MAG TPA: M23 family metallopeptidase [Candidatus Cloacimonadota bacterium]|nr:M23 family metallopeptidase [Candidatus Cloacimonadota bacterium]